MECCVVEVSRIVAHGAMEDDWINLTKMRKCEEKLPTEKARFSPTRSPSVEAEESSTIYSVGRVAASRSIEDKGVSAATAAAKGTRRVSFICGYKGLE